MPFLSRYEDDPSRPTVTEAMRDIAVRMVAPGVVLFGLVVGMGLLLVGPASGIGTGEERANRWIADRRTPTWNTITFYWTHMAATEIIIGVCLLGVVLVWWRTRQWWYAVIPLLAITLQAIIFVSAATVVGRQRPPVPKLDTSPPTASFPSGHEGASTALYLSFLLMATRIRNRTLRYAAMTLCAIVPLLVGYSRFYRGMHHISDLLAGMLVGGTSAVLAWNHLRRSERTPA